MANISEAMYIHKGQYTKQIIDDYVVEVVPIRTPHPGFMVNVSSTSIRSDADEGYGSTGFQFRDLETLGTIRSTWFRIKHNGNAQVRISFAADKGQSDFICMVVDIRLQHEVGKLCEPTNLRGAISAF